MTTKRGSHVARTARSGGIQRSTVVRSREPLSVRFLLAALAAFATLAIWRYEVLWLPPYYETAMGLFREADFLAATDFDYLRLRFHEPPGNVGGAYAYM